MSLTLIMGLGGGFVYAVVFFPFMGLIVVKIVSMMMQHELEAWVGFTVIFMLSGAFGLCIASPSAEFSMALTILVALMIVFYPFAQRQLARATFHDLDVQALERVMESISAHPDLVPAYFELAQRLHALGMEGQAIAIAERTVQGLSQQFDAVRLTSQRDHYRQEESRMKQWKRDLKDPHAFRPIKCPQCHTPNPPGEIACVKCRAPYLALLFRGKSMQSRVVGRLLLAYALTGASLIGVTAAAMLLSGTTRWVAVFGTFIPLMCCLAWLFRFRVKSYDNLIGD